MRGRFDRTILVLLNGTGQLRASAQPVAQTDLHLPHQRDRPKPSSRVTSAAVRLDDVQTLEENKANRLKQPMERRVFPAGKDGKGRAYDDGVHRLRYDML